MFVVFAIIYYYLYYRNIVISVAKQQSESKY